MKRYVRDDAVVDDMYQETSIKVIRKINTVRDRRTVRAGCSKSPATPVSIICAHSARRPAMAGLTEDWRESTNGEWGRNPADQFLQQRTH